MKKIFLVLIMFLMFAGVVSAASINGDYKGKPIVKVKSNGKVLAVQDAPAVIMDSRTMVPIYMLRDLGAEVTWNEKDFSVDVILPKSETASVNINELYMLLGKRYVNLIEYSTDGNGFSELSYKFSVPINEPKYSITFNTAIDYAYQRNLKQIRIEDNNNYAYVIQTKDLTEYYEGRITADQLVARYEYVGGQPTNTNTNINDNNFVTTPNDVLTAKEIAQLRDRVGYVEIKDMFGSFGGNGSGFVLKGGLFITNSHVATAGYGMRVYVDNIMYDPSSWYVFNNSLTDVYAVLLSSSYDSNGVQTGYIPEKYLEYTTVLPEVGDIVYAIGSPNGYDNTVSDGIVSAIRDINGITLIQHTADTESGSSGGALLNEYGEVIGITSSGIPNTTQDFAIPMMYVQEELNKLN